MKTINTLTSLLIIGTMVFSSCSKDRVIEEELNSYGSLNEFYDSNKPEEQSFQVDTAGYGPIEGKDGTLIYPSDSSMLIVPSTGNDPEYPYELRLVELYTAKDMILYEVSSLAGAELLNSDGEIRVRAYKNNEELELKPSGAYVAEILSDVPTSEVASYYGTDVDKYVDWSASGENNLDDVGNYHKVLASKLGWVACDKSYSGGSGTTTVTFSSDVDDLTNVAKWLYFGSTPTPALVQVTGTTSVSVPSGVDVTIICFASDSKGQMYSYTQDTETSAAQTVDVVLSTISESGLLDYLGGL